MTGETMGRGRQTATGVNEYLPAGADFTAWKETPPGSLLVSPPPGLELLRATEESGTRLRLYLEATGEMRIHLARWYFPGWQQA